MHYAEMFNGLGLFTIREFLDADICARLMTEIAQVPAERGTVTDHGVMKVDDTFRRAKVAQVDSEDGRMVEQRLLELRPRLESFFDLPLRMLHAPSFLRYDTGDYCGFHIDRNPHEGPDHSHLRQVSIVVFLNRQKDCLQPGTYSGGSLAFYGLIDEPGWRNKGLPCPGEPGLLVAFRSTVAHAVNPVTSGTRGSVISWFG